MDGRAVAKSGMGDSGGGAVGADDVVDENETDGPLACAGGKRLLILFLSSCLRAASFANHDDKNGASAAPVELATAAAGGAEGDGVAAVLRARGVKPSGVGLLPSGVALRSGVVLRSGVADDCG